MKVDKEDLDRVSMFRWSSQGRYLRTNRHYDGHQHNVYLHNFLIGMALDRTLEVDHINRDPLDNRKSNLRFVSRYENMQNREEGLGVYWDRDRNKWVAQYSKLDNPYIGSFKTKQEAINAYKNQRRKQCQTKQKRRRASQRDLNTSTN